MPKNPKNILNTLAAKGHHIPVPRTGSGGSTIHSKVLFSFALYDRSYECLSEWTPQETRELFDALRQASQLTWMQVFSTGGTGARKVGLGWTDFGKNDPFERPAALSPDMTISEIRITEKARIFGSKKDAIFYIIRLDREHKVC